LWPNERQWGHHLSSLGTIGFEYMIHCCKQCFTVPHCWWRYVISSWRMVFKMETGKCWHYVPGLSRLFFEIKVGFKLNLVPNVAKNLINIKHMYIYSLFCRASGAFKMWVKYARRAPMHGIDI
jgi:hypothetical protein